MIRNTYQLLNSMELVGISYYKSDAIRTIAVRIRNKMHTKIIIQRIS